MLVRKIKNYTIFCIYLAISVVVFGANPVLAQQATPPTIQDTYKSVCGKKFDDTTDPNYNLNYKSLRDAQQYDLNNPQSANAASKTSDTLQAGCPPSLKDITYIVIKIITILITVTGLIAFFNIVIIKKFKIMGKL